jgi:hypothetical protein
MNYVSGRVQVFYYHRKKHRWFFPVDDGWARFNTPSIFLVSIAYYIAIYVLKSLKLIADSGIHTLYKEQTVKAIKAVEEIKFGITKLYAEQA